MALVALKRDQRRGTVGLDGTVKYFRPHFEPVLVLDGSVDG